MLKVYKYSIRRRIRSIIKTIPIGDEFEIDLPRGAKILSFQCQHDMPNIWALVNPDALHEKRQFRFSGTGHPINIPLEKLEFIGTAQMQGGDLIWHLFEVK